MALKLTRLSAGAPIVDANGMPTSTYMRWWNDLCTAIETAFNGLSTTVAQIEAVQAAAAAAAASAATAQSAATTATNSASAAQNVANTVTGTSSLQGSYVNPTNVLSATDAGASATITVSGHTRVYGDGTSVAVTGGALTGLAYSTSYSVYYDQASRLGGAVTYVATANPATASPSNANPDRHFVGAVKTPAAFGAPVPGIGAVSPNITLPTNYY